MKNCLNKSASTQSHTLYCKVKAGFNLNDQDAAGKSLTPALSRPTEGGNLPPTLLKTWARRL